VQAQAPCLLRLLADLELQIHQEREGACKGYKQEVHQQLLVVVVEAKLWQQQEEQGREVQQVRLLAAQP
jgi:hypothetical protein